MSLLPDQSHASPMNQKTIEKAFVISGIGMHSGKNSQIKVSPAPEDCGIVFIKNGKEIKAAPENATDTKLSTTLGGIKVVEHLLAAVAGLGLDNLRIEVSGEEIPILDGSALPYAKAFQEAGIVGQKAQKKFLIIKEKIHLEEEGKSLALSPANGFKVIFMVDYPTVGKQEFVFKGGAKAFLKEIAPARTFGYVEKLEELQAKGFARGASTENALAITAEGYLNPPRFADEVVRHKILDLMGDLALVGQPIRAEIVARQSGHRLNLELVRRLRKLCQS